MATVKDVREPTPAAALIVKVIRSGNFHQARALFTEAINAGRPINDLVMDVAAAVEPAPNIITLGLGVQVFGNPFREGWAWRCGVCLHAYRAGGRLPCSGVNYKTFRGAHYAAHRHRDEEHDGVVQVEEVRG